MQLSAELLMTLFPYSISRQSGEYPGAVAARLGWQKDGILTPVTTSSRAADRSEKRFFAGPALRAGVYHTVVVL